MCCHRNKFSIMMSGGLRNPRDRVLPNTTTLLAIISSFQERETMPTKYTGNKYLLLRRSSQWAGPVVMLKAPG